jgi:ubiquinone/menaquinone biosynthesis C-methylase UbiE
MNTQEFWQETWHKHYKSYARTIGLQAYHLSFILQPQDHYLLEIGAGSFRDTALLNQWGYNCLGCDFSHEAVRLAQDNFPQFAEKLLVQDAAHLQFADKSFDVSFHSGFFGYFDDKALLNQLVPEQVRVTRNRIVCTVHNKLNTALHTDFTDKAREDRLFDIRFFEPQEVVDLLQPYCTRVEVFPYGNGHFNRLIKLLHNRVLLKELYKRSCRFWALHRCERLMVVGHLDVSRRGA